MEAGTYMILGLHNCCKNYIKIIILNAWYYWQTENYCNDLCLSSNQEKKNSPEAARGQKITDPQARTVFYFFRFYFLVYLSFNSLPICLVYFRKKNVKMKC